ncbi:OmpA/MotB domain protein [Desulfamplus magnetovallimortis]|uniref:OmpA/MotB domain protein n=1 Tax=Desulfamplus magnetovallimortis TaxID=1246637 RepID=A0A1W1H775_9BACT|nr:OmpA family protein [Desulfamplus magnetovallimortis]SLM28340.1 OmpA/MotB domain protein [Desulfamplus magnetovallimortis]
MDISKSLYRIIINVGLFITIAITGCIMTGCATKIDTTVVLLPEPDGSVGEITVSTQANKEILNKSYESARVEKAGKSVEKGGVLNLDEVQEKFGVALAAQPLPPVVFILYFQSGGTELTDESKALIPDIMESINNRQSTDISVVGHTDRVGTTEKNWQLSMERAGFVVEMLISRGVKESIIEQSSHGESNPIIETEDEVAEPRNRRVEVMVR